MGTPGTVIVAIPSVDDHVWKVSSEKVPHLTMVYLGDIPDEDLAQIAKFLEHVAKESLTRFGMSVDKRGTLGDDEADVLFFEKEWAKEVETVRGYLLQNDLINKAYQSADQYPQWTPHLTLGYPESPAKEDDRDYPISWVNFDRLALWVGDFDGPEFELAKQSDRSLAEAGWAERADAFLEHYGVKGMRWGIRKSEHEGGTRAKRAPVPVSADKARANAAKAMVGKKGDTSALSNQELQQLVQRMNLEQQYSRLSSQPGRLAAGQKKTKEVLDAVETGKRVYNITPTPIKSKIGKLLRRGAVSAAVLAGRAYYKTRG